MSSYDDTHYLLLNCRYVIKTDLTPTISNYTCCYHMYWKCSVCLWHWNGLKFLGEHGWLFIVYNQTLFYYDLLCLYFTLKCTTEGVLGPKIAYVYRHVHIFINEFGTAGDISPLLMAQFTLSGLITFMYDIKLGINLIGWRSSESDILSSSHM